MPTPLRPYALVLAALLALVCASFAGPAQPLARRALWITRFDYRTAQDVERAIDDAHGAGFDTVLFQVRGNATAFYPSSLEPWAEQLGGKDPGFDPLAVAIEAARARRIELHAWVNVMPAWWGTTPPKDPAQLWNKHKSWLWVDQKGATQAFSDKFYVSVNPCLPEVRRYIVEVMRDLVARYPIDGLHLDYIRFPNEAPGTPAGSGLDYPRDAKTLALFKKASAKTPEQDKRAWNAWRADQVTALVREIRAMIRETKRGLELSCAVGPDPERALHEHFQDVRAWLDQGLVDVVYPMNYTRDPAVFASRVATWRSAGAGHAVVMGLRIDDDAEVLRAQIAESQKTFDGYALFAYASIFDSPNTATDVQDPKARAERAARRKKVLPVLRAAAGGRDASR